MPPPHLLQSETRNVSLSTTHIAHNKSASLLLSLVCIVIAPRSRSRVHAVHFDDTKAKQGQINASRRQTRPIHTVRLSITRSEHRPHTQTHPSIYSDNRFEATHPLSPCQMTVTHPHSYHAYQSDCLGHACVDLVAA